MISHVPRALCVVRPRPQTIEKTKETGRILMFPGPFVWQGPGPKPLKKDEKPEEFSCSQGPLSGEAQAPNH